MAEERAVYVANASMSLADQVGPLFAGKDPAVQGGAIARLAALWISGHHPSEVRPVLLALHIETVRSLFEPPLPAMEDVAALIERHQLHVWPPQKWKGDLRALWTVRKQDENENTVSQERAETLAEAVRRCVACIPQHLNPELH